MNPTHHKNMKPNPATSNQQQRNDQPHDQRSLCSENENPIMAPVRGEASP